MRGRDETVGLLYRHGVVVTFEHLRKASRSGVVESRIARFGRGSKRHLDLAQTQRRQPEAEASDRSGTVRAGQGRAALVGGGRQLSGWELDLLVTGYLSAVARELRGAGLIETGGMQLGPADPVGQLSGRLTLRRPGEQAAVVDLIWGTDSGWRAQLTAGHGPGPSPRFLHSLAVPAPGHVAAVVTDLCRGHEVGFIDRPRYPEHYYGHRRGTLGHAQVIASLAWFALPEVRGWATAPDSLDPEHRDDDQAGGAA
jgi:hypothetical protein